MAKTQKQERFDSSLRGLLYNLCDSENNNLNLTEEQVNYYRGIIMASVCLTMAEYGCEWAKAMQIVKANLLTEAERVFNLSLPKGWQE